MAGVRTNEAFCFALQATRSPDKVTLLTMLYTIHRLRGEFDASLRPAHEAYAAAQALFGAGHPSLNDARLYYSQALSHAGRHREAAHEARAVLAETEQLFGASGSLSDRVRVIA